MDILNGVLLGFSEVMNPMVLLLLMLGSFIGTLTGAMPGLGPSSSVALLLPFALSMETTQQGLALLVSIYLGCMFGGRITAILINIPGDAPAVVTAWDGYPMMKQGRGGIAMGISAIASFIGGGISFIFLACMAPTLANVALAFGPPEYFAIMIFGFAAVVGLAEGQYTKAMMTLMLGILVSCVGADVVSGTPRFVFSNELFEGIPFTVVVLGCYGLGEVLRNAETAAQMNLETSLKLSEMVPSWNDIKSCLASIGRGTVIGGLIGMLPGAGATVATFITYSVEKNASKNPDEFGTGKIQGVAAPEAANNAAVGGAMVPMLALGIPGSGTTAMLLGALTMFGLQAGPRIFQTSAEVVWTMIVGLIVANLFLLVANILLIPVFVGIIRVGQRYLKPIICVVCIIGVYAVTYSTWFVGVLILFAVIGYFFKKYSYPSGTFILALILSPLAEKSFRQAMLMSRGNYAIFFTRPISIIFLLLTMFALCFPLIKQAFDKVKGARKKG